MTLKSAQQDPEIRAARSAYFQEIARRFLYNRGAPFSLSSKDLALIARWEEMRIPLPVVLEGIDRAFEVKPRSTRGKARALSFCGGQVEKLFRQVRDAAVGREMRPPKEASARKSGADEAIRKFLESLPSGFEPLREIYTRALEMRRSGNEAADEWEQLEDAAESAMLAAAADVDRDEVRKQVAAEFRAVSRREFERILRIKTVKFLRDKYKIPHLSPYYY